MRAYRIDKSLIVQLGLGLIGSSVSKEIMKQNNVEVILKKKPSWNNPTSIVDIIRELLTTYEDKSIEFTSLHILWTAGKAGFLTDEKEANYELEVFDFLITHIYKIAASLQINRKCFYLISSAGGLFEGQQSIDHNSSPIPKRPYGKLKLQQEKRAIEIFKSFNSVLIYRPSSVFSFNSEFGRRGLINTLIKNIKTKQTTSIYGSISTLRDYVLDDDVASIIISDLTDNTVMGVHKYIIASGRPISIFEIINKIQRLSDESPYLAISIDKHNSDNITYNPNNIRRGRFGLEVDFLVKKALMKNQG